MSVTSFVSHMLLWNTVSIGPLRQHPDKIWTDYYDYD